MQHQFGEDAAGNLEFCGQTACRFELRNFCATDNLEFGGQAAGSFDLRNVRQNPCGNSASTRSGVAVRAVEVVVVVVAMVVIAVVVVSCQS